MPFVETVPEEDAAGAVEALYARGRASLGYLSNMSRIFSARPDYTEAWSGLLGAIRGHMDPRRYKLATLAAARCFFSKFLDALGAAPDAVYGSPPAELRDALTVGRAIEDACYTASG